MNGWHLEVTYNDGTVKNVKTKNKVDTAIQRQHYLMKADVKSADAFDGEDYIDPCEL